MRFSIRDLLWATLVVAMGLGWWASYRAINAKHIEAVLQAHRQRATLEVAKQWHDWMPKETQILGIISGLKDPNWRVLDEPGIEP